MCRNKEPYLSLYKVLGFYPVNVRIYEQALVHKSSSMGGTGRRRNNERLEFLGDAMLSAVVADMVYRHFENKQEGFLTNTRSKIVQRETLNHIAVEMGLDKMVIYSLKRSNAHNNHIYGNALEALIGAVYLDQGYRSCFRFVENMIVRKYIDLDNIARKEVNFKSRLIEWSQKNKLEITFKMMELFTDDDGCPVFQTGVVLSDELIGVGTGYSKKESQQHAAMVAMKKLRKNKAFRRDILSRRDQTQEVDSTPSQSTDERDNS